MGKVQRVQVPAMRQGSDQEAKVAPVRISDHQHRSLRILQLDDEQLPQGQIIQCPDKDGSSDDGTPVVEIHSQMGSRTRNGRSQRYRWYLPAESTTQWKCRRTGAQRIAEQEEATTPAQSTSRKATVEYQKPPKKQKGPSESPSSTEKATQKHEL